MIASSTLHQAAVHPHEPAPFLPALTGWSVLRRRPARAFGVIRSAGLVTCPAEVRAFLAVSSLTERLARQGWPLLSGSLFFRVRSCLQALTVRACVVVPCRASPMRLTGIN